LTAFLGTADRDEFGFRGVPDDFWLSGGVPDERWLSRGIPDEIFGPLSFSHLATYFLWTYWWSHRITGECWIYDPAQPSQPHLATYQIAVVFIFVYFYAYIPCY
jgi:hypothetical protein